MLEFPPVEATAGRVAPTEPAPVAPAYAPHAELQTRRVPATANMRGWIFNSRTSPRRSPPLVDSAWDTGCASRATDAAQLTPSTSSQSGIPVPPVPPPPPPALVLPMGPAACAGEGFGGGVAAAAVGAGDTHAEESQIGRAHA